MAWIKFALKPVTALLETSINISTQYTVYIPSYETVLDCQDQTTFYRLLPDTWTEIKNFV